MFKYLLALAACFIVCGCHQPAKVTPWSNTKKMLSPPGFIVEIPLEKRGTYKGKLGISYTHKQTSCRLLRLDSLEAGFDSIQVRVWLGADLSMLKHVVIIEKTGVNWDAKLLTIQATRQDFDEDYYKYEPLGVAACTPVHGWDYLLTKMKDLQITELPNGRDIGNDGCIDGSSYLFEIATHDKYRFIQYGCPELYADKIWQAKNIIDFAELLEEEFGFKFIR